MEMAAGVIAFVREKGLAIPREVSIVSFDDPLWARYMDPPLTVVAQPMETMGKCTMELLLGRLRGDKPVQTMVFTPDLLVRQSTCPPAAAIAVIAEAIIVPLHPCLPFAAISFGSTTTVLPPRSP